ncbi:hypothetical protein B296_00008155 [Ensete ventricosum]|uniref:Uncharacterized protein n=1 Tax=Ensete ventricosum TaxID=4639 RepID=A0A426ZYU6_ENSVE|nr:hypothetical protein B296_00008155 [Ensete ventricosum]
MTAVSYHSFSPPVSAHPLPPCLPPPPEPSSSLRTATSRAHSTTTTAAASVLASGSNQKPQPLAKGGTFYDWSEAAATRRPEEDAKAMENLGSN